MNCISLIVFKEWGELRFRPSSCALKFLGDRATKNFLGPIRTRDQ
jgi:hypothetical protein